MCWFLSKSFSFFLKGNIKYKLFVSSWLRGVDAHEASMLLIERILRVVHRVPVLRLTFILLFAKLVHEFFVPIFGHISSMMLSHLFWRRHIVVPTVWYHSHVSIGGQLLLVPIGRGLSLMRRGHPLSILVGGHLTNVWGGQWLIIPVGGHLSQMRGGFRQLIQILGSPVFWRYFLMEVGFILLIPIVRHLSQMRRAVLGQLIQVLRLPILLIPVNRHVFHITLCFFPIDHRFLLLGQVPIVITSNLSVLLNLVEFYLIINRV